MPRCSRRADPSLHVRQANIEDVPAIIELERQSSSAAHWPREQYENLFVITNGQPRSSQRVAWVIEKEAEVPAKTPKKNDILAFLVAHRIETEWELENIVVAHRSRRQSLGTILLRKFITHARTERSTGIFLEVRESNQGARTLYGKLGFEEAGLRKNYYASPAEDAILYRLLIFKGVKGSDFL